jgi:hypothetical protein
VDGNAIKGKGIVGQAAVVVKMQYEVKAEKAGTLEIEITTSPPNAKSFTKTYKIEVK